MTVTIRLFASARDAAGWEHRPLELPEGATVAEAELRLRELVGEGAGRVLASAAFAVNQQFAARSRQLREGDEVAVLPPVSGG